MHTPGPWHFVSDTLTHRRFDIYSPCGLDQAHEHVCTVNDLPHERLVTRPLERAEANARLIQSAPVMFDILERLLSGLCSEDGSPYDQDLEDRVVEARHIVAAIKGK